MFKNKKIPHIEWLPIILLSFIFFKIINNFQIVTGGLGIFLSYVNSFVWAFAIAYLLNPMMVYIEKKYKTKRTVSLLLIYLILLGFIILSITIVSPKIAESVKDLYDTTPTYIKSTKHWFDNSIDKLRAFDNYGVADYLENTFNKAIDSLESKIGADSGLTGDFTKGLTSGIATAFTKAVDVTSSLLKIFFGFIVSIYMLKDKEKFIKSIKRFFYAILKKENADNLMIFSREVNVIFSKYILGKSLDSLIIGVICLVGLTILKIPYATLISLIVGVTNMIPYFGPFIGAVPAVLITLLASPIKAVTVFIFIVILQQFDGWFLGPKILGSQVGLSPFWIILAIIIGGGLYGPLGMFLAVPIMAVIKTLLEKYVTKKLNDKKIDI